jgi:hypothetical protein
VHDDLGGLPPAVYAGGLKLLLHEYDDFFSGEVSDEGNNYQTA